MFQKLITAAFLILLWSPVFSQIKPHPDGFLITREFAEFVAARFDSLKTYQKAYNEAIAAADSCSDILWKSEQLNILQERNIAGLEMEISELNSVIDSYKRQEIVMADIQKRLKKETRRRKFWQIVGIGTGTGLLTTIFILAI